MALPLPTYSGDYRSSGPGALTTEVLVQSGLQLKVSSIASGGSDTEIFDLRGKMISCSNGVGKNLWSCKFLGVFDPASTPSQVLDVRRTLGWLGHADHISMTPRVVDALSLHCLSGSSSAQQLTICLDPRGIVGYAEVASGGHLVTLSLSNLKTTVPTGQFLLPTNPSTAPANG
jgi:hypothetical protein